MSKETPDVAKKTVILQLTLRAPGMKRSVRSSQVRGDETAMPADVRGILTDADPRMLHISKDILQSPFLKEVADHDAKTRDWVRGIALPSMMKGGLYPIKTSAIALVDDYLQARLNVERPVLVERFLDAYPAAAKEGRKRLKSLGEAGDYPSVEELRRCFRAEYTFVSFSTPEALRDVRAHLFEREQASLRAKFKEIGEANEALLLTHMKELVKNMLDSLRPDEDGNKKRIHKAKVANLSQFLEEFTHKNLTEGSALEAEVVKARKLMEGIDPDILRKNDSLRGQVAEGFAAIATRLAGMTVTRPDRVFGEEEEE